MNTDTVVVTEDGDRGLVTAAGGYQDRAYVRFPRGSGTTDGWYPAEELNEAADQTWPPAAGG